LGVGGGGQNGVRKTQPGSKLGEEKGVDKDTFNRSLEGPGPDVEE